MATAPRIEPSPVALDRQPASHGGHRVAVASGARNALCYLTIGLCVLFAAIVERPQYLKHLGTVLMDVNYHTRFLEVTLTVFLAAKSLLLFVPVIGLADWISRRWSPSLANGAFCLWAMTWCSFSWLDIRLLQATGNHALDYATFAFNPSAWEWAGRDSKWISQVLTQATCVSLGVGLTLWLLRIGGHCMPTWLATRVATRAWLAIATYAACLAGGIAFAEATTDFTILTELRAALPIRIPGIRSESSEQSSGITPAQLSQLNEAYRAAQPALAAPLPADTRPFAAPRRPHLVVFVLESLRASICEPAVMPRLNAWSERGTRCESHFSNSNCSQFGMFSLLYGRWPLAYEETLNAKVPPQLCVTLRNLGYTTTFVTSADDSPYRRMGEYLNEETFDRVAQFTQGDWVERDRESLAETRRILSAAGDRPQLVVVFLMSTHVSYAFPEEFAKFKPYPPDVDFLDPQIDAKRGGILNRYRNSAHFLDHEIGELVERLPTDNALVVVTGDHGESLREDGVYGHASKLSDVQTRTPFMLVGPQAPVAKIKYQTSHVDLLPTLFHLIHGRPVSMAGTHGASIFDRSRDSNVVIVNGGFFFHLYQEWDDFLVVNRASRLRFLVNRKRPTVNFLGALDAKARNIPVEQTKLDDAAIERIAHVLGRMAPPKSPDSEVSVDLSSTSRSSSAPRIVESGRP